MSDLAGIRTKKVTTYGRRGRSNVIAIHNDVDISPLRPSSTTAHSPVTPLKRPPLSTKLSQDFANLPIPVSPDDTLDSAKKETLPLKPRIKPIVIRSSSSGSDSPMFIRRIRPGRRAIIPSTPSTYAPSPASSVQTSTSRIDCVEIPVLRQPRQGADHRSRLGRYRESSEDLAEDLKELVIADPSPILVAEPSVPFAPNRSLSSSSTTSTLEAVCSLPDIQTFDQIFNIAKSFGQFTSSQSVQIVKAGEATYSEVFSVLASKGKPIVMKVIPITRNNVEKEENGVEVPFRSSAEDVAKEVEITKKMSQLEQGGFVEFIGAYVVRGRYPARLLSEWDNFAEQHDTENIRPSCFTSEQEYVVIFLHDGGIDLEAFQFQKKAGWVQAAGVFWQVADALARAEQWTKFEHRDLHEGQILIKASTPSTEDNNYLDPNSTGIRATIIDFGLSRLQAVGLNPVVYSAIPEEVLEGEGEQWDVYRAIYKRVKGDWEGYHPITNLMWLQYILGLLLHRTPTLKKPRSTSASAVPRPKSTTRIVSANRRSKLAPTPQVDRSAVAYTCLLQTKEAVDSALGSKARGAGVKVEMKMESAGDLMVWARERGLFV